MCGGAFRVVPGNQQSAERVQVATQHAQSHVTLEPCFAPVPATRQAISRLQRTDRRLHARVMLHSCVELGRRRGLLLDGLFPARLGQAEGRHDPADFLLVRRRVKASVKRAPFDLPAQSHLQEFCLLDHYITVGLVTGASIGPRASG